MQNNDLINNIIEEYYQRALIELRKNNGKQAKHILYNEMSKELYDISLNILYYTRPNDMTPGNKKIFDLIEKVDNLLNPQLDEN